jgi:hypothetical protein
MRAALPLVLLLAACAGSEDLLPSGQDAGSTPDSGSNVVAGGGDDQTLLKFAVFGDARPPNVNATTAYPTDVVTAIFTQAQARGAQFAVGTGDYMFAKSASAVDAQVALLQQAESSFHGPVYHALGNHECTGYTNSNCPAGNETPNVVAFMKKLVPAGVTTPWYRVDLPTAKGKAKILLLAANAWGPAQESWLAQQLSDPTTYTILVRHEPDNATEAPGVMPSGSAMLGVPYTLLLLGHTHEFVKLDARTVISGNAGAPLSTFNGASNYGFLLVEQQADGNLLLSAIETASGNVTESWRVTPDGNAAP